MSSIENSNSSSNGNHQNVDAKVLAWMGNIFQDISTTTTEDQLMGPPPESPLPRYSSDSSETQVFGKPLSNGASPAYVFAYAALYINLPIPVICHELSRCHFRTTTDAVRHLLYEIDRSTCAEVPTSLFPPDAYTVRALVTFLIRLNVPAQAIWQNVMDWSGLPISGGVSRVRQKRNIFERMNRFLMETPDRAAKPGFEIAYIDNAYDLGFSSAQMVYYLTEAFPQASTWMTKEYVYDVLVKKGTPLKTMTTGRRPWDRAGEEFSRIATSVVGLSDERMYCCLLMAGYDIECDLELAEHFLARKEQVPSPSSPPPPPPAAAAAAAAADEKEEGHEKVTTKMGGKIPILPRKEGPPPSGDNKEAEEKPDSYW